MEKQEILEILRRDFQTAKKKLEAANEEFDAVIRESPSGLPYPDSVVRIQNVSRGLTSARQEMIEAHVRLNAFIAEGIVPDKFRNGVEPEQGSSESKKGAGES